MTLAGTADGGTPTPSREERRRARDEARGYSINRKYLAIAILTEAIVIATSLVGAYLFATRWGRGNGADFTMMLLAPLSYAIIEMCRVPLALTVRTQRSVLVRCLAVLGVVAAAGVTVKSMSQLGELMFRPRLLAVTESRNALHETENTHKSFHARRDFLQGEVQRLTADFSAAMELNKQQAANLTNAKQVCQRLWVQNRDGSRSQTQRCNTPPAAAAMIESSKATTSALKEAEARLATASEALRGLGTPTDLDKRVTDAKRAYADALTHSQLHAFTGMFFAVAPAAVSEGQISEFLRLFVFLPAICVSLASTLLAMAAVTKIRVPKKEDTIHLDPRAGLYVLDPFARQVVEEATAAAKREVEAAFEKVRPLQPKSEPKVA